MKTICLKYMIIIGNGKIREHKIRNGCLLQISLLFPINDNLILSVIHPKKLFFLLKIALFMYLF